MSLRPTRVLRFSILALLAVACCVPLTAAAETLIYHQIRTDKSGRIVPWFDDDPGRAYDHVMGLVWNFWDTMRTDPNGLPYYMNHQVWRPDFNDPRGLGGDQLQMAMSSWRQYYAYSGSERVKQNTLFLADYYLEHGLSPADGKWPDVPFPYNTLIYSGKYDGDMILGPGFLQPDKAGSLGLELARLHKMHSRDSSVHSTAERYRTAAIKIARTLIAHLEPGDAEHSPLPFKVNALTGEVGQLRNNNGDGTVVGASTYTSNWCPTLELLIELQRLDVDRADEYHRAFDLLLAWMKKYPIDNQRWGPFFEDVQGWSDTQINAITCAQFIMEHRDLFPDWKLDVERIFAWVYATLGNKEWEKYGVLVVNEQTVYQTPGQSHNSRQAAAELLFCRLTGDDARKENALRQLAWATYMVDVDGKNLFPTDEPWLTDGYGDYVRHYLRAMAACPEIAPSDADHILSSTSVVEQADYNIRANKDLVPYAKIDDRSKVRVFYKTFDRSGEEVVRVSRRPAVVLFDGNPAKESKSADAEGYQWTPLARGGVVTIKRRDAAEVLLLD
jgi:hypothetical protein